MIEQIESQLPADLLRSRADLVYEHTRPRLGQFAHSQQFVLDAAVAFAWSSHLVFSAALRSPRRLRSHADRDCSLLLFSVSINHDRKPMAPCNQSIKNRSLLTSTAKWTKLRRPRNESYQGQPLLKLKNRDLEIEITNLQGQLQETRNRSPACCRS